MGAKQKLLSAFDQLPDSDSWIRLSDLGKVDPGYMEIVQGVIHDVEALSGRAIHATLANLSVFMASRKVVSPYHIDHEANFLCQIAGHKEIWLYDPYDRELLSDEQIEQFYAGDGTAARYREDLQSRGKCFQLAPGRAVHHPSLAAHRVRNGPEVSISVGISFCTRELDRRARVYQANHLLRKAHLTPTPPGRSPLRDAFKASAMQWFSDSRPTSTHQLLFSGLQRLRAALRRRKAIAGVARSWLPACTWAWAGKGSRLDCHGTRMGGPRCPSDGDDSTRRVSHRVLAQGRACWLSLRSPQPSTQATRSPHDR